MTPQLSIITPVFNGEKFVRRCYWSLEKQTVEDWEWIVVDDGSTDRTVTLLAEMAATDSRVRCLRNPRNVGIGYARTRALQQARAPWIIVADIDDISLPWRLERVKHAAAEGYDFSCSLVVVADPTMRILGVRDFEKPLYTDNVLAFTHPTLACRTDLARTIGYSSDLSTVNQIGEDRKIILTLAARYKGYYHQAPLVIHQPSVGSLRRSIHSNLVGVYRVSQLFRDGTLALSYWSYLRTQARNLGKIALLNLLRLWPAMYDRIMDRRRLGPPAEHYRLTTREAEFIERCTDGNWTISTLSAPLHVEANDLRESLLGQIEQPVVWEDTA